jgi:serine/threonine protein kinase
MIGMRVGSYEITALLGEGGMGEVYRARDTRLGRDVAIKVLPSTFAQDPDRLARFEREAQVLAALNHPNIAHVYGLEEGRVGQVGGEGSDSGVVRPFLIMELLEGQPLAALLTAGSLPARKAVEYAAQLARGLAAAHDRGIVHRDLKPDNVFVLPDGRVKILDFGLARRDEPLTAAAAGTLATAAPGTSPGMVLGTVGYMSPEQVRGEPADARSDLFSLGVVLYEMLSGQRPFRRDTTAETMTAILREEPQDLSLLRADINPALERIVRHCLEKNPVERFQTARDVAFALDGLSGSQPVTGVSSSSTAAYLPTRSRRLPVERLAWASIVVVLAAASSWLALHGRPASSSAPPNAYRTSIIMPEGFRWTTGIIPPRRLALSPDGTHAAVIGDSPETGWTQLWVVRLSDGVARQVTITDRPAAPFWSPDSQQIAFSTMNGIKRVSLMGNTATPVANAWGEGAWLPDGTVLVFEGSPHNGALKTGVSSAELSPLFQSEQGRLYGFPQALPGSRDVLYSEVHAGQRDPAHDGVYARERGSERATRVLPLLQDSANAYYANGYLLFTQGSTLYAQPYDIGRRALTGRPSVLTGDVMNLLNNGAAFTASTVGTVAYEPLEFQLRSRLLWTDRSGSVLSTISDVADYSNVELSPNGRRLAVSVFDQAKRSRDMYIVDLARNVRQRLTSDADDERSGVWSPDGSRIVYNGAHRDLFIRRADFTGAAERVVVDGASKDPRQISQDGRLLLFRRTGQGNDLWVMPLDGDRTPHPLVDSPFDENYGTFSPDAKSVAYASNETGQFEIYVISLEGNGGKSLISSGGGSFPRWRADGKEIVYLAADGWLMSVPVSGSGARFTVSTSTRLFKIDAQGGGGDPYDMTADGQHFIVNSRIPSRLPPSLTLIVNWPSLVRDQGSANGEPGQNGMSQ